MFLIQNSLERILILIHICFQQPVFFNNRIKDSQSFTSAYMDVIQRSLSQVICLVYNKNVGSGSTKEKKIINPVLLIREVEVSTPGP
jgi:hypothetical protein